ncbi:MAG: 7-cyano-7-deazaguanine synthase [Gemmataceae bacterium]
MESKRLEWPPPAPQSPLAVLISGGLDSAVLLAEALTVYPAVQPIFVRVGSLWEEIEERYLRRFLQAVWQPNLRPLLTLSQPVDDLYGNHWSLTGEQIPDANSADDAVFLPGRNVLLLAKALLWCHLNGIPELATAPLVTNPFPDATPTFYDGFAAIVSTAVAGNVRVLRPYANLGLFKVDVLRRGAAVATPFEHTFSCIDPQLGLHCGRCNKCAERQQGFAAAGLADPTHYADVSHSCLALRNSACIA